MKKVLFAPPLSRFLNGLRAAVLLCVLIHILGTSAFAGPGGPTGGFGGQSGPSSGTIIAAAMETAGYVSQAQIFADLERMLTQLGGLIYLCCVISAIMTVALSGRYPTALWLLVGPALFYFLIAAESAAGGVDWQFGAFRDSNQLDKILRGANIQQADGYRVSNFFHKYNVLISHTYQELIKILTKQETRQQMLFMARQKVLDDLFDQPVDEPGLYQLTRFTFLICDQELSAARLVALGQKDPEFRQSGEYSRAVEEYCQLYPLRDKLFPNGQAKDYVKQLMNRRPEEDVPGLRSVSCKELWGWMERGSLIVAERHLTELIRRHVPRVGGTVIEQAVLQAIRQKLSSPSPFHNSSPTTGFQCVDGADRTAIAGTDRMEGIPFMMTAWMMRRVAIEGPIQSQQVDSVLPNSGIEPATLGHRAYSSNSRAQGQEVVRRYKSEQLAESAKYEVFMLAKLLPYLQGAGLYVLATIYPFFCLMVILPGHAGGFFVWMTLWAWLKSWDVGWALVYVADQLLWALMPHRSYFRMSATGANAQSPSADPVTILEAAFRGDYSYSLATYWVMVAGMLGAVPVISAHAILGSKRAIAGMFVDGAKTIGQPFSRAAGDWVAMEQLGEVDRRIQQTALFSRAAESVRQDHAMISAMQRGGSGELYRRAANARMQVRANEGTLGDLGRSFTGFRDMWNRLAGGLPQGTLPTLYADPAEARRQLDAEIAAFEQQNPGGEGAGFAIAMRDRWQTFMRQGKWDALANDIRIIEDFLNSGRTQTDIRSLQQRLADETQANPRGIYNGFVDNETFGAAALRAFHVDPLNVGGPTPGTSRLLASARETYMNSQMMAVLGETVLDIREPLALTAFTGAMLSAFGGAATLRASRFGRLFRITDVAGRVGGGIATFELAEMQRFYFATQALSLDMERTANHAASQYLTLSARHYFYQAARSDEFANYERIRAGITGRAEWWGCPEAPHSMEMEADREVANLQAIGAGWLSRMQVQGGSAIFRQIMYSPEMILGGIGLPGMRR